MTKSIYVADEAEMLAWGGMLAKISVPGTLIGLQGELGAGKTTLSRGFMRALGYQGIVRSPTYALVETYELAGQTVCHFDLYRLSDPQELLHIGLSDYLDNDAIILIEWPEIGKTVLPPLTLSCHIKTVAKRVGRQLELSSDQPLGQQLIENLPEQIG